MKSTGIVRKIDALGRVVLPKELRRTLNIADGDPVEIFVDGDQIILKKYQANMECAVTGEVSNENISVLDGKLILSQKGIIDLLSQLQEKMKTGGE
ncbi:transcriptional pleiotropic regulator of transition state genes [Psychrobacillus insolitus]|uniref:Transcriptional pleiotropic regulator of transition state genes n=1 Tax=Psychrobacillus insolitus TaxID=1461 RepID=A0A2W7MME0_9BACI|nr:AbrB/MazE/SpoVT family DNA-binding domain-containing protein [Psychrobacillus insolitus]PZX07940.1 transcriptional pleiotropic regulator of transition state genes [Psychrobacillus insolitus]